MDAVRVEGTPSTHVVTFEPGEDPVAGLARLAAELALDGAGFTAIGAFEHAVVGWFDLDRRDYQRIPIDEQVEVLSLLGDITKDAGSGVKVHAHAVLGRRDGSTMGGHLLEASVRPTLEVVITETPARIRRRHDPATGLGLIDLSRATGVVAESVPGQAGGSHDPHRR
jgi:predicted DNA-binding protein with PD1-like motif